MISVQPEQPPATRASFNNLAVGSNGSCAVVNDIIVESTYRNATFIFDTTDSYSRERKDVVSREEFA